MSITKKELQLLDKNELISFTKKWNIKVNINSTKSQIINNILNIINNTKYKIIKKIGDKGQQGIVYLAKRGNKEYAMKTFKQNKSGKTLEKEAKLQELASKYGISPKVYDYNIEEKYIVMDKLEGNILELIRDQGGILTLSQEKRIIDIFKILDKISIYHRDPNPLNFLYNKNKKIYIIDYGLAREIDENLIKKHGDKINVKLMSIGFLLKIRSVFSNIKLDYIKRYLENNLEKSIDRDYINILNSL